MAATGSGAPTFNISLGLSLPGTSGQMRLMSLQGSLQLSLGDIRLMHGTTPRGAPAWLLKISRIVLKLFGLPIPLSGDTTMFLFADPEPDAPQNTLGWYAAFVKE